MNREERKTVPSTESTSKESKPKGYQKFSRSYHRILPGKWKGEECQKKWREQTPSSTCTKENGEDREKDPEEAGGRSWAQVTSTTPILGKSPIRSQGRHGGEPSSGNRSAEGPAGQDCRSHNSTHCGWGGARSKSFPGREPPAARTWDQERQEHRQEQQGLVARNVRSIRIVGSTDKSSKAIWPGASEASGASTRAARPWGQERQGRQEHQEHQERQEHHQE